MNELPLISVIVPVYKTEMYLRRCLDSICNQSYRKLEIICVNDGSPDKSEEILREYAARDNRIHVINQENAGLSAARNSGLKVASGDYITGVDSDDYLDTDIYSKIFVERAISADIICFGTRQVDECDNLLPSEEFLFSHEGLYDFNKEILYGVDVCFWNKLYKREMVESLGLTFPEGVLFEDTAWLYTCAAGVKSIYFLSEIGYNYVQREGSITNGSQEKTKKQLSYYPEVFRFVYRFYSDRSLLIENADLLCHLLGVLYDKARKILKGKELAEHRQIYKKYLLDGGSIEALYQFYPVKELLSSFHRMNPFYRRSARRVKYCVFWLPILEKRIKRRAIVWTFLGVPIHKTKLPEISDKV